MIKYRFIRPKDPDFALERGLRWETIFKPMGMPPGSELTKEDENGIHLVAFEKKEIIGTILFSPISSEVGSIVQMAIAPQKEHQGFSRKLLHHLETYLQDKGFKKMEIHCSKEHADFYLRLGFHKAQIEVGNQEMVLYKNLEGAA
jgi:N-acetylglutamate synthase-like GNAT family acetyltransferase